MSAYVITAQVKGDFKQLKEQLKQVSKTSKITVDSKGHVSGATAVAKSDITALGIPGQDTNTVYTHPSYTAKASGLYKVTVDDKGHVSAATAVTKSDITGLGIPGEAGSLATLYTYVEE